MARTSADIFRILTLALQKIADPAMCDVHILRVEVSKDLSSAKVFVNNGAEKVEKVAGFFKTEIANNMRIKRVPNLRFIVDDGEKNAQRVEELLKQISQKPTK